MNLVYQQKEFLLLVLHSFLCGAALGATYDLTRIIRLLMGVSEFSNKEPKIYGREFPLIGSLKSPKAKKGAASATVIFVCDLLFMLIAAIAVLCVLFFRNDGRFRWVVLLFTCGGFVCYYSSIGYLVIRFSYVIAWLLRIVWAYIFFFVSYPVKYLIWQILRICRYVFCKIRIRMLASRVEKEGREVREYLFLLAQGCFLKERDYNSEYISNKKDR